jgi:transposase-like protein
MPRLSIIPQLRRLDDAYVRGESAWKYLYRAVNKAGATVDWNRLRGKKPSKSEEKVEPDRCF